MADIKKIREALARAVDKKNGTEAMFRANLMDTVGADIVSSLQPLLKEIATNASGNKESLMEEMKDVLRETLKDIKIEVPEIKIPDVNVNVPDIIIPDIAVPRAQVDVRVPDIKISDIVSKIQMPKEMDIKGWVSLMGVSLENPLPVQLRDASGRPVNLLENLTTIIGGNGGGGRGIVKVSGFEGSAYSILQNGDGRLKVSVETGGSGLTDSELRATSVPVEQVSGSTWSVSVNDIFRSTVASALINGDDRLRVSVETGGSGLTDAELRATAVPVSQVSGAIWSTEVKGTVTVDGSGVTQPVSASDLDIRDLVNASDSVRVYQLSGASWSVEATQSGVWNVTAVTDVTNSVAVKALPETLQVQLDAIETAVELIDNAISGSEMQVDIVSGFLSSSVVTGPTVADAADDGSAPVQIGGIARQTNPTAVADGDVVKASRDDLGRAITRPMQARDLIASAYVTITTGIETTLLAATAGAMYDLIYVMAANASDAAQTVDIRGVTGGNVLMTLSIPANGTVGIACPVPLPQTSSDTGNAWTVDNTSGADLSTTSISISALFSKEI